MNYDIHSVLEQLEANLKQVDSARAQVEQITSAYNELKGRVDSFVSALSQLLSQFENLRTAVVSERGDNLAEYKIALGSLKQSCETFVLTFGNKCDGISTDFKNKTAYFISETRSEIGNLHTEVERLETLEAKLSSATDAVKGVRDMLETITTELRDSQKAQDDDLAAIKTNLSESFAESKSDTSTIKSDLKNISDKVAETGTSLAELNTNIISKLTTISNELSNKLSEIGQTIGNLGASVDSKLTAVSDEIKSAQEKLGSNQQAILKEVKTNRTLFLVGIAVVAILSIVSLFIR